MPDSPIDIVIFGATSFVGKLVAHELSQQRKSGDVFTWAIAGRSQEKLQSLQRSLCDSASVDIIVADSSNIDSLYTMCRQARLIISCVGPYALYGEHLIQACVDTGTDYCDLCGESQWLLQMLSKYQAQAMESGARIVPSCGFDSIPSDLGVFYLQEQAQQYFGQHCEKVQMRVKKIRGKLSGGTYASIVHLIKEVSVSPALRKALANPYCFCPSDHPYHLTQHKVRIAEYDESQQSWLAPFIMENINTRTVHRTNALLDHVYGENFLYDEAIMTGTGRKGRKRASRISYGTGLLLFASSVAPLRNILQWWLPKPGEGPSQKERDQGRYELVFIGKASAKGHIQIQWQDNKDPGYGSTAKMLTQAALCLTIDCPKETSSGGFWTPASLFGEKLISRLQKRAGIDITVTDRTKH
ncbi:MAG: saccharopine dehydrogenase NADP-binding domain-containing protein [Agarilytica sp.]